MAHPGYADEKHLRQWADTTESKSEFPRLIRRLILETGSGVVRLGFAAGEGVSVGGWDGSVRAEEATAFIPRNLSVWELSVEKAVTGKANDDYAKRTCTPDASPTADCTYVQVSLRLWRDRDDWARGKSADGRWREVRAYGLHDVVTWLENAPVTHAWLSDQLGLAPYGVVSADTWWCRWSQATYPILSPAVVLAGRGEAAESLKRRVEGPPGITTIWAPSEEDALAFLSAWARADADRGGGSILARMAIVDEVASWRSLQDLRRPLILVPRGSVRGEISPGSAHHVLVPVWGPRRADSDVILPQIDIATATQALKVLGMGENQAEEAGILARLSLLSMRRHLARSPALHRPPWASGSASKPVRTALVLGRWNDEREADRGLVADLAGVSYEEARQVMTDLQRDEGDSLVARVDLAVGLVSPVDAWLNLGEQLQKEDLERLNLAVQQVLLEVNPALELPAERLPYAQIEGKVRAYSDDLRRGLASTLAVLGTYGDRFRLPGGNTAADWARGVTRRLLEKANKDLSCRTWASLASVGPLLAEAAPDEFLDAVRCGLSGNNPVLSQIFMDTGAPGVFTTHSPHTGLLWALEIAAWPVDHFGDAVELLARLAELDPGGRLANRPYNSLAGIFCPWRPDTAAGVEARLLTLDALRRRHSDISWRLLLDLLPEPAGGIHMPTATPEFRDWVPPRTPVLVSDYGEFLDGVFRRLTEDAALDSSRWSALIENMPRLRRDNRRALEGALRNLASNTEFGSDGRREVWHAISRLVRRHGHFGEAPWAMSSDDRSILADVAKSFEPTDPQRRHAWLFEEQMPKLGDPSLAHEHHLYEQALAELRIDAVREIYRDSGILGLRRFAIGIAQPWAIGRAMVEAGLIADEAEVLALLDEGQPGEQSLAWAYIVRRFESDRWAWADSLLACGQLSVNQKARLLLASYDYPKAWERAETEGEEVASALWQVFQPQGLGSGFPHVILVAEKLLNAHRIGDALLFLELYLPRDGQGDLRLASLVLRGLETLLTSPEVAEQARRLSGFEFRQLFDFLHPWRHDIGVERLARLEFRYMPALASDGGPPTLHDLMNTSPTAFVEMVSAVFRPSSGPPGEESLEPSPDRKARADNAWRVLMTWRRPPGLGPQGDVDGKELRRWVDQARALLLAEDRVEIGDYEIGRILARIPDECDGSWPGVEVRELLEDLQSKAVEEGLFFGRLEAQGPSVRGVLDGGEQERALRDKDRKAASRFVAQWPRAAAVLRRLANYYDSDARRQDDSAERFRTGFSD